MKSVFKNKQCSINNWLEMMLLLPLDIEMSIFYLDSYVKSFNLFKLKGVLVFFARHILHNIANNVLNCINTC